MNLRFHLSTRLSAALAFSLLGQSIAAQEQRGQIVATIPGSSISIAGTPGLFLVDRPQRNLVPLNNQVQGLADLTTIISSPWRSNRWFCATDGLTNSGQCDILDIQAGQGSVSAVTQVNRTPLNETFVSAMCIVGNDLFYLGQNTIGRIPLATRTPETLYTLAPGEGAFGMASDGRWLYVGTGARRIVRIELAAPTNIQQFAILPATVFDVLMALAVDSDGNLLAARGNPLTSASLLQLDSESGAILQNRQLALTSVRTLAVDPQTSEILISGNDAAGGVVLSLADFTGAERLVATYRGEASVALRRSWPLHVFGTSCPTHDGLAPEITANRTPVRGASDYTIRVDTLANQGAVLLGAPHPGAFADIETSLQPFGAPGCALHLNVAATRLAVTGTGGRAEVRLSIPNTLALRDAALDFQWLVLDPTANAAGLAMSQAGATIID